MSRSHEKNVLKKRKNYLTQPLIAFPYIDTPGCTEGRNTWLTATSIWTTLNLPKLALAGRGKGCGPPPGQRKTLYLSRPNKGRASRTRRGCVYFPLRTMRSRGEGKEGDGGWGQGVMWHSRASLRRNTRRWSHKAGVGGGRGCRGQGVCR